AGHRGVRTDQRARDAADRRGACHRLASGVVPAAHAAGMPDRSPLHARHRRVRRRRRRAADDAMTDPMSGGATIDARPRRAAVFLDRDGTLIEDVGYLDALSRIALFPWTIDAIRALNRAGLPVVVVTNQSG